MLVVCTKKLKMKTIFLFIFISLYVHICNAQTIKYNQAIIGSWLGELIGKTQKPLLELKFSKVNINSKGKGTVSGFSYVNGENKTGFNGTVKIVDGYIEFTLKEIGVKTTNGVFLLATQITELLAKNQELHLDGSWTSNKTKQIKQVSLVKI